MGQAEERIKDYMDNLDQHYAEHYENENLQNEQSNQLKSLIVPKIAEEIDKLLLSRQEFLDKKIKDDFYNKGTGWTREEERAYILGRKHEADNNRNLLAKFSNSNFSA